MDAPTNIVGPDGTLLQRGEPIPADWFKELPDLQAHLDNLPPAPKSPPPGSQAAARKIAERHEAAQARAAGAVKATAKVARKRGTTQ